VTLHVKTGFVHNNNQLVYTYLWLYSASLFIVVHGTVCLFLASSSSNYDYLYDDSSDSGLSTGAIAGITIGGILLFIFTGTLLIVTFICMRHRYVIKQQSHSCNVTQQADQRTLIAAAPPSPLPCAYNPTLLPTVYCANSRNSGCVSTPHQFNNPLPPTGPQPEYFPGQQPQYTPGSQPEYISGPQPDFIPGPLSGYTSDPQSGYISEPSY